MEAYEHGLDYRRNGSEVLGLVSIDQLGLI